MRSRPASIGSDSAKADGRADGWGSTAFRVMATAAAGVTTGCSRSPSQNILGSYFPSWLLCLLIGVVVAVIARGLLIVIGLGEAIYAPLLTYPAIALAVTFTVWLLWFGN